MGGPYKVDISRFPGGYIDCYDLSQIELRIAALLSGDPIMLSEYQNSIDRHTETAKLVFPFADPSDPNYRSTYRQAGKTLNFLILYRGGATKFQETVMKDVGLHLTYETCESAIHAFYSKYLGFKKWQDNLLETVRKQGYLELPTGWSRSFGSGQSAVDSYINEICNFPIQTIAAQLLQSAEYAIMQELTAKRLFTCIPFQIYDALYLDVYPSEEPLLGPIISKHLSNPPLLSFLEQHYGNSIPILFEKG
jgi:DNA polymerase-1